VNTVSKLIQRQMTPGKALDGHAGFEQAAKLDTKATSDMRAFVLQEIFTPDRKTEIVLCAREESVPPQAALLANHAWRVCDGVTQSNQALTILKESRIEYARAALDTVLFHVGNFSDGGLPDGFLEDVKARNWHDADEISRRPISPFWNRQSAADTFDFWCYCKCGGEHLSTDKSSYICKMLSGIALTWIDHAISNTDSSLALMAEVASAMRIIEFYGGWTKRESIQAGQSSNHGKKMATARHQSNRDKKQQAIKMYQSGNYTSKDQAATAISQSLSVAWRTCREWLKGA
jgi:hypothetical protein